MILTQQQIVDVFINTKLEGDYDLLQDDLVKLANALIEKAAPELIKQERAECVKFVRTLNHLVGDALQGKRGSL